MTKPLPDPLPLFDTHAHLDFKRFEADFDEVLSRARQAGLQRLVTIGASNGLDSNRGALALAEKHDWIYASVGIHPHQALVFDDALMSQITEWASTHPKVVAVGETGLDYHYEFAPKDVQAMVFSRFVALACEVEKPLVVHTREADEDTIALLRRQGASRCGGIIHCFSSGPWLAEQAMELGFYLSFSGIVTFKSAKSVREVASTMPLDRMLIETDCPYLAPVPCRGERNEPAYVNHTARCIATLRGLSPSEVAEATLANGKRLFKVD